MAGSRSELEAIRVRGAREHNLKSVDVDLPKRRLVVITGVSGSGKSSLAFDTIFAEGQRRYVQSLSAYARQFIGQMEKPKYDTIRGLCPAIAIDQKASSVNPRSTVGTITEIYDYLRVLYARIGRQYCLRCGKPVGRGDAQNMVDQISALPPQVRILILAPVVENRKGRHGDVLQTLQSQGYARLRVDGVVQSIESVQALARHQKHTIEAVVDRLVVKNDNSFRGRLVDSVETALKLGRGRLVVHMEGREDLKMSEARSCCGIAYPELEPPLFSFNSPQGMCPDCNGIGNRLSMDPERIVPQPELTIRQGAVLPWHGYFSKQGHLAGSWGGRQLEAMRTQWHIDFDTPWRQLPPKIRDVVLYGSKDQEITVDWNSKKVRGQIRTTWEGLVHTLMRRHRQTESESQKKYYARFMSAQPCPTCRGRRLQPAATHVRIADRAIVDVTAMTITEAHTFLSDLSLNETQQPSPTSCSKRSSTAWGFCLTSVSIISRWIARVPPFPAAKVQRIRLASQVGSELTGVLYILDEPSIGLHQRDNLKLLATLRRLRDIGNSVLVIEHDRETMQAADWIVDMGPGAGLLGGQVVATGTPAQIGRNRHSLTGLYLSGKKQLAPPEKRITPIKSGGRWIEITGAAANNLKKITVKIPLGLMTAVTGVSGAGKSTLINQILYPALARHLHTSQIDVGAHRAIHGLAHLNKVININQRAIGRTPRSNPATYTKLLDHIRDLFARLPEARVRGYAKGRFSFNVKGGRCEACRGDGYKKVAMHFLADVYVPCQQCRGRRYNDATLTVRYKGHSIADVLELSVRQARALFRNQPRIVAILDTLMDVGLGYIKLGQSAPTLSGGEAQRIKLSRELAKKASGDTLYILDEPTTGLHFADIKLLITVLRRLVDDGNSVVIIEHNLDIIKSADWIIDLGPEGGDGGGRLVAQGSPETIAGGGKGYTAQYLKPLLV